MIESMEQWKDEVMDSLNGLERVKPNPFLFAKIRDRIGRQEAIETVGPAGLRLAFASIAILVAINISVLISNSRIGNATGFEDSYSDNFSQSFNLYE